MTSRIDQPGALEQLIVERASILSFSDLPRESVAATKRLLLDTLAVAWVGATTTEDEQVRAEWQRQLYPAVSTYWANGDRISSEAAAFLNGLDAAAMDYDSVHYDAVLHPDVVTIPVVLALGERVNASGAAVLLAITLGDDLLCRLSLASSRKTQWFDTSVHGIFGATLAGGLVLGKRDKTLSNALSLALSFASGTKQPIIEKSHSKRYQSAFAARNATSAALLAAAGVSGPTSFLTGEAGFLSIYDNFDASVVSGGYGAHFENTSISIKKFPNCLCNYAPISAALRLRQTEGVTAEQIASISVTISPYMNDTTGGEFTPEDNPTVAGMFSVKYAVASALVRGRVKLTDIEAESVLEPSVGTLAQRIRIRIEPSWSGFLVPARIDVALRDGRSLSVEVTDVPGGPEQPLTEQELKEKVDDCYVHGPRRYSESGVEDLKAQVMNLEELPNISQLTDLFRHRTSYGRPMKGLRWI